MTRGRRHIAGSAALPLALSRCGPPSQGTPLRNITGLPTRTATGRVALSITLASRASCVHGQMWDMVGCLEPPVPSLRQSLVRPLSWRRQLDSM